MTCDSGHQFKLLIIALARFGKLTVKDFRVERKYALPKVTGKSCLSMPLRAKIIPANAELPHWHSCKPSKNLLLTIRRTVLCLLAELNSHSALATWNQRSNKLSHVE